MEDDRGLRFAYSIVVLDLSIIDGMFMLKVSTKIKMVVTEDMFVYCFRQRGVWSGVSCYEGFRLGLDFFDSDSMSSGSIA
jgi:hypothetical protein